MNKESLKKNKIINICKYINTTKPFKIFFADEMRYGLITNYKRSWSKIGKRSKLPNQMDYSNRYLYTAIAPFQGDSFNIIGFDKTNTIATNIFIDELNKVYTDTYNIIIWDNAPFHKPRILQEKENSTILTLPSYSQELNPCERFFLELRRETANKIYSNIDEIETKLDKAIVNWQNDKKAMQKLACWDWIESQILKINNFN